MCTVAICCGQILLNFPALQVYVIGTTLHWRHNEHYGVSNHQPFECLHNRLFRRRTKKTSNLRVTGLCERNSPVNSPHKGPETRKMLPFDDAMMNSDENLKHMGV